MDKRWRNLMMLIVLVIIVIAGYYFYTNFKFAPSVSPRVDGYVSFLAKDDVNYGELKVDLEFFEKKLDDSKLNALYAKAPDEYMKSLLTFEKRENAVYDKLVTFYSRTIEEVCPDLNNVWSLYDETNSISLELNNFLSTDNSLLIDSNLLLVNAGELEDTAFSYQDMCDEITTLGAVSQ